MSVAGLARSRCAPSLAVQSSAVASTCCLIFRAAAGSIVAAGLAVCRPVGDETVQKSIETNYKVLK